MAVVGVSTGVMKPLLSKLTKLLEEEYVKLKGVRKQIKFLRDELGTMSDTLEMLADAEHLNPETRLWRDRIRELAYDLEDCIDAFVARVDNGHDGQTGFKKYFRKLKRLKARHEIANQIKELKACVVEASERHKRYKSVEMHSNSSTYCVVDPRLAALYVEIDELVGIDGPKKHIIEWLTMKTNVSSVKLKVLSIVGCGGLGKTTLANQVYQSVKSHFSCTAFVSVSRNPDVKKILRDISKEVGILYNILDHDEKQLIDELRKHLREKRYLIVIDDIWDAKPWETIKLALVNKNCESRVITTTRSTAVASCLSSQGCNVYQMKSLSFQDSKRLLLKRAFGSENLSCTHLGSVPDEILRKCDGLPLAIITISSILADKHAKCEWDRVLHDIGSTLAKNTSAEKMTAILSMSYFDIPCHLRTCLLYLSVFPEDYKIQKQRLINRWSAEGFIHEEEGQTKYEMGEGYFNDLINRSMIQPVDVKYGQAEACRVHDIILDYIKCKAVEENFVTSLDAVEHVYSSGYKVRRICVSNHAEENVAIWADPILSHVRSVTMFCQKTIKTSLLRSTALRVLDLGDCLYMDNNHIANIEKFFHLKYLSLCSYSITKLPEKTGELQYLQTLDVRLTSIKELPSTITKLQRLAHLYVDYKVRFPDGMIGQMHGLEELREYGVQSYEQGKTLEEFSKLTNLRTLNLRWYFDSFFDTEGRREAEDCHSYAGTLLSSCNLYNLYITDSSHDNYYPLLLDSWHPAASCSLRKLYIKNCAIYKVPNWMGSLGNLAVLKLNAILCLRPEDIEILGAIPSLFYLRLVTVGGTKGRIIIHGSNGFRSLKYFSLRIDCCGTALDFQEGSMPNLEHVKLMFGVHKRECLNGASSLGIQHLSALSKVEIKISGNCIRDSNYDPTEDENDGAIKWVASAINSAVVTHPNRPTVRFETKCFEGCEHFEYFMREFNKLLGGLLTEWLKIWQIEEEQTQQEQTDGLNRRITDEEEQTGGEEGEEEADIEEEDTYEEEGEEQSAEVT
ncbi:unnamed protein product [Urochloa decumbens]|uniref:Uncharacterized protein n=1 Tax=Urochloa decumbens TaxID=240449 RepID=A0ABC9BLB9_9POAL